MPERYLITHAPDCGCTDQAPRHAATTYDVALYLWGRDVARHIVYDGECPYHFATGDVEAMLWTLAWYAAPYVQPVIRLHGPLTVPLSALRNLGGCRTHCEPGTQVVCVIGDMPRKDHNGTTQG